MSKATLDIPPIRTSEDENEGVENIDEEENENNDNTRVPKVKEPEPQSPIQKIELKPSDFYFGATLGEGAFARVVHAKSKKTGTEFAIKIMEKAHIKRENKVKHVLMERKVLTMISHPFIVKFHFSFQDPEYLFMCMDLVPGGILLDLILLKQSENVDKNIPNRACSFEVTQFYTAEMIEALEYLHTNGIIHRDLKPENILIDQIGHIKITDFGTSAICTDNQSPRTSFVGTQDYVSPEVLSGERKATRASDLWAVGCMIYQMLTGISPFRGQTEYLTFELIMGHCKGNHPLQFPDTVDPNSQDLISALLRYNDYDRLGGSEEEDSENGYSKLKAHPLFSGIAWGELIHRLPPYQPDSTLFPDSSNMRDGAQEDWTDIGEATPITHYTPQGELLKHGVDSNDEGVQEHNKIWNRFLLEGENQLLTSTIYKRKGLFSKKRQLVLTDKPRLIYIDPDTMELKGEIPWTRHQPVSCTIKNSKEFDVKCSITQRVYHLSDSNIGSQVWVEHINVMLERERTLSVQFSSSPVNYLANRDS